MNGVLEERETGAAQPGLAKLVLGRASAPVASTADASNRTACFHCGEPCLDRGLARLDKVFCCPGCLFVHDLLTENGLQQFYGLNSHPGVRVRERPVHRDWTYLDEPSLQAKLLDFTD